MTATTARCRLCLLLVLAATLAGCATSGNDQNYRELERDDNPFYPEIDPTRGEAPATAPADEAALIGPGADDGLVVLRAPEPSLEGLGREHWPEVIVTLPDIEVADGPNLFPGSEVITEEPDVLEPDDIETRLTRALEGGASEGWSRQNATDVVVDPVQFGLDLALLPVRLITQPEYASDATY